jgi:glycosyltransferase A (GT-A) superfamily protein (DUF2064 family)
METKPEDTGYGLSAAGATVPGPDSDERVERVGRASAAGRAAPRRSADDMRSARRLVCAHAPSSSRPSPAPGDRGIVNRVVVFARGLRSDAAGSRLSPALPGAMAADLRAAMLADTLAAVAGCEAGERRIAWASADDVGDVPAGFGAGVQHPGATGERLERAFGEALAALGDRAIVVGSGCPALEAAQLDAAFDALATHDLAIGPASGGGCWLVALARPAGGLFRDIPWTAGEPITPVLDYATALGLRVALLPVLDEIGTPGDLAQLVGSIAGGSSGAPPCGPRTLAALRAMGLVP